MELHIFMTCEEFVSLLNEVAEKTGCRIFSATSSEAVYQAFTQFDLDKAISSRNIELGFVVENAKLLSKPVKDIYREDRVGFISVHSDCNSKDPNVLIETVFTADPSDSAKIIFKNLRKAIGRVANRGVKAVNEKSGVASLVKSFYWTRNAVATGKIWRQTENSWVRFKPAIE